MKPSLLAFALTAMLRRRARSLALGGGLAFAVALVSAVVFLTGSLRAEVERAHAAHPDVVVQRLVGGRPSIVSEKDAAVLADVASVRAVTPRVWGYVFVPALQGNVTVMGTREGTSPLSVARGTLEEGRDVERGKHEMVAGKDLARFLGMRIGDELALPSLGQPVPLRLVGTFRSALDLYTADVLLCDEADARALLGMPEGSATDLAVSLSNPAEARIVAGTVADRLPGTRVVERDLLARVYHLAYGRRAGFVLGAAIPALLALLVLAWDRASGLGEGERREIAVLKAVGWSTSEVLWAKLFESMLVGAFATAVGLLAGYLWIFALGAPGLRASLVGWSVLYPRAPLTPAVDLAELLGITLSVLGPFVFLSIVPAWRAATSDPLDTMRG